MPEAGYFEIKGSQPLQTTPAFFEVLVSEAPSQTHHIAACVSREEDASVSRPKKSELPCAVTGDMDGREATGYRQLVAIVDLMFNRRGFDWLESHEQSKQEAGPKTRGRFHRSKSIAGGSNRRVQRMHVSLGPRGLLKLCQAADVVRVSMSQDDMTNVPGFFAEFLERLKNLGRTSGQSRVDQCTTCR